MWQLCPKCQGQRTVSKPPWVPGDAHERSASQTSFTCDMCNGDGKLWAGAGSDPHSFQEHYFSHLARPLDLQPLAPDTTESEQPEPNTEQADWIAHSGGPMPSDLAPMQWVMCYCPAARVDCYYGPACNAPWYAVTEWCPILHNGHPCCSPEGLKSWAQWVICQYAGGPVYQCSHKPWHGVFQNIEVPMFGRERGRVSRAPATHAKPGHPADSRMYVLREYDHD